MRPAAILCFSCALLTACESHRTYDVTETDGGVSDDDSSIGPVGCGDAQYSRYREPGADGVWNTTDDVVVDMQTRTFNSLRQLASMIDYTAPGGDGIWGTPDDVIADWNGYDDDAETGRHVVTAHDGPGPDGEWLDADDRISNLIVLESFDGVAYTGGRGYAAAGPDDLWGTPDDIVSNIYVVSHPDRYQQLVYGPGLDGRFDTTDDAVVERVDWEIGDDGGMVVRYFNEPGADGMWGSDDDVMHLVLIVQCDRGFSRYDAPGPDGVWETVDDHVMDRMALTGGAPCQNVCQTLLI